MANSFIRAERASSKGARPRGRVFLVNYNAREVNDAVIGDRKDQ
ncbi:MAG: hypothetical protein V7L11_03145 [Nostoc sp.]